MDLIQGTKVGVWSVPFISAAYLINGTLINRAAGQLPSFFARENLDADMAFCANLRESGIFMHVTNRHHWGHLVNPEGFSTARLKNELWEADRNPLDWERRYIRPDYFEQLAPEAPLAQPCPDVFWFPVVTDRFADEFVAEMENYGMWSDGSNHVSYLK